MKSELRTITPDWARKMLQEKNVGNRPINRKYVDLLANEIKSGRWMVNGSTICYNKERLIDGQHRLAAIAQTGIAVQTLVVDGISSDAFPTIDVGKRRSHGDTLAALGEKNHTRLGAALVLVDKYMTGRADKSVDYTNTELEELLEKYPDIRESLQISAECKGLLPPSVLDACHYIFSQLDKPLAITFIRQLLRGTGLEVGDPCYELRERLLKNAVSKAKLSKHYIMALCIKAWNHERKGRRVRSLRWRETGNVTETFPVAI
jgi:hypothetical protein